MHEFSRCWAEIDLARLRHNLSQIRSRLAHGALYCFVIKADAYGHGLVPIAQSAENAGADWFAVATVSEGVALRKAGIQKPILVLAPLLPLDCELLPRYDLRNMVEEADAAEALSLIAVQQGVNVKLHLKVDTGMARFGVQPSEAANVAEKIASMPGLEVEGIATHFSSCAVDLDYTAGQYRQFLEVIDEVEKRGVHPPIVHCCNSAALILASHVQNTMVRSGLLAYGIRNVPCPDLDLLPVMTWRTRILALREIPAGKRVGYAGTWTTDKPTRIATLGTGYADGYARELSNKGRVLVHGKEAPIRGIICMDQCMVDVTEIPDARVGDVVGLVEGPITAERMARWIGTTPHEIPCRLTRRVERVYVNE